MNDAPHTIPEHIAERVAKLVNAAEDMRQQAADDLKQIYADLREELRGMGWNGAAVSAEIAGFKGAIAELRLDEQAKAKREAKGDRIDVYADMLRLAGARARTREASGSSSGRTADFGSANGGSNPSPETIDPETGQIIETQEFQAKASEDNGATGTAIEVPSDSVAGEVSRQRQRRRDSGERPAPNSAKEGRPEGQAMTSLEPHEMDRYAVTAGETATGETGMVLGTGKERPLPVGGDADGDPEARFKSASLHHPHSTVVAPAAIVEQPEAPNSSPATSGANSRVAHVDDFDPARDMPSFLRRTDKGAMSGVEA